MERLLSVLAVAAAVCACNPLGFFNSRGEEVDNQETLSHGMIVLGPRLEDPYSVENITKALASLYPTKAETVNVPTTHLYVRFLPSGEEQFEQLQGMGVDLLDHPVDFKIEREGDYYHDPDIPDGDITWQYAVVPPDFVFPAGIKYEVLDKCHITEVQPAVRSVDGIDWEEVERESFRLTGNEDLLLPRTKAGEESVVPEGRITIVDEYRENSPIGVAGVRVSCNTFVKFAHTFTDGDGYYKMGKSFSSKPRYRLVFKNKKGFAIGLNLLLVPASVSTLGKQEQAGCSVQIDKYSNRALFTRCVVNNAGWDYYEKCKSVSGSICTPPGNLRIWIFDILRASSCVMMQQGVGIDNTIVGEYLGEYSSIVKHFLPDLTLGLKDAGNYASIYATTIHEMAHASHFMQAGSDYWNKLEEFILTSFVSSGFVTYGVGTEKDHGYCEVAEMWAYYMQTRLYRERYPESDVAFGTSYWFYPQIFNYLDERGLTCYKAFNALQPTVIDRDLLQEKLVNLYPEAKTMILLAFNRYR